MKAQGKLSPDALIRLADRFYRHRRTQIPDRQGQDRRHQRALASKDEAEALRDVVEQIAAQQETLYAQNEWGVLL